MKKILFIIVTVILFVGCSGGEELVVDTQMFFLARSNYSGNNTLTATFCVFKNGDYDPMTFKYSFDIPSAWESAEIKTKSGETVKASYIDIVLDHEGYGSYKCSPGDYYVVAMINSNNKGIIWKSKKISVTKNKATTIEPIFKNTYASGYFEWDE